MAARAAVSLLLIGALLLPSEVRAAPVSPVAVSNTSAEQFVRRLYAHFERGESPPYNWHQLLAPETGSLWTRLQSLTNEEPAWLDADPICDCQDYGGFRVDRIETHRLADGHLRTQVTLTNFGGTSAQRVRTVGLELVARGSSFLIYDVLFADGKHHLRTVLEADARQYSSK